MGNSEIRFGFKSAKLRFFLPTRIFSLFDVASQCFGPERGPFIHRFFFRTIPRYTVYQNGSKALTKRKSGTPQKAGGDMRTKLSTQKQLHANAESANLRLLSHLLIGIDDHQEN